MIERFLGCSILVPFYATIVLKLTNMLSGNMLSLQNIAHSQLAFPEFFNCLFVREEVTFCRRNGKLVKFGHACLLFNIISFIREKMCSPHACLIYLYVKYLSFCMIFFYTHNGVQWIKHVCRLPPASIPTQLVHLFF